MNKTNDPLIQSNTNCYYVNKTSELNEVLFTNHKIQFCIRDLNEKKRKGKIVPLNLVYLKSKFLDLTSSTLDAFVTLTRCLKSYKI